MRAVAAAVPATRGVTGADHRGILHLTYVLRRVFDASSSSNTTDTAYGAQLHVTYVLCHVIDASSSSSSTQRLRCIFCVVRACGGIAWHFFWRAT